MRFEKVLSSIETGVLLQTVTEVRPDDARHTRRDGDGGQAGAVTERTPPDARHVRGDGDGGQAGAAPERRAPDARHT